MLTAALVAALLAVPPGALAQSAGDEQYTDPFAESDTPAQGQQQQQEQAQAPSQPAAPQAGVEDQSQAAPAQVGQQEAAPTELPRTGGYAVVLALATGSVLVLAGFAIRRTA
jgi:hypothetical protein